MATSVELKKIEGPQTYRFEAINASGLKRKEKMVATSEKDVFAILLNDGFHVTKIDTVKTGGMNTDLKDIFGDSQIKFDHRELADFTAQFHQLLKAGVSVTQAFRALGEETSPNRHEMCEDLAEQVSNGVSLHKAFADYPKVFDVVFRSYIRSGEDAGTLVETTERLAVMLDRRSKLALKIKSVTAYPKMVSLAIGGIVIGIMLFMVPMFEDIYAGFDAVLPAPTRALVAISDNILPVTVGFQGSFPFINDVTFRPFSPILWGAIIFFAIRYYLKKTKDDPIVGIKLDRFRYGMPIFGRLAKLNSLYRWASTLAAGIESGVQLQKALELAANTSGSRWQMAVLPDLQEAVQSGKNLSEGLALHKELFPPSLRAMVSTGESAGDLPSMLKSVASSIDSEIDMVIAGLSAKIEVALLLIMGVIVGGLLAALYMPILNLATTVGSGLSDGAF